METVYIVGIIAVTATVIVVVWLLRDRITRGHISASIPKEEFKAGIEAAPPAKQPNSPPERPASVEISNNWMIGSNLVRVWRNSVRVVKNKLWGKQKIDIAYQPQKSASKPEKEKKKKKK